MNAATVQTHDSMTLITDVMKLHRQRDFIRAELVKALQTVETLPEEVKALLIADQNATAEWQAAFTDYKGGTH